MEQITTERATGKVPIRTSCTALGVSESWYYKHRARPVSDRGQRREALTEAIWEFWSEHGKNRERVGEFIQRVGLGNFLDEIGLEPIPEMVMHPRTNPYIFFEDELDEGDDE